MIISSIKTACVLFLMLGIGLMMCRFGWIKSEQKSFLTKFIVNICVPGMCVANILGEFDRVRLLAAGRQLLALFITMGAMLVISLILVKILRVDRFRQGTFVAMSALSNSIFIGLPVSRGIFGEEALPYVMIYYFVNTTLFWGFCNPLIQHSCLGELRGGIGQRYIRLLSPPLLALLLCIIAIFLGFNPPQVLLEIGGYFANCITPLSMIVVSAVIYETGFKTLKMDRDMAAVLVMRFAVSPALSLMIGLSMGIGGLPLHVFAVQASLPVMMQSLLSAQAYAGDTKFPAGGIIISTVIGLAILPILTSVMAELGL